MARPMARPKPQKLDTRKTKILMPKQKYRTYGTGSLYYNKNRDLWIGTLEAGWTAKGTRKRITVSSRDKTKARKKLDKARYELQQARKTPTTDPTLKTWAVTWLEQRKHQVRPATYIADRSAIEKYAIPLLGRQPLSQLRPSHIKNVANTVIQDGGSPSTAERHQTTIIAMLKDAKREGYPVPDPVLLAQKTHRAHSTRTAIPLDDAIKLLHAAAQTPAGVRWVLALLQGLRQGEALGLTWDRIDFRNGTIDISWQLQALTKSTTKKFLAPDAYETIHLIDGYHLVRTKTKAGMRIVPMVPWVAATLKQLQETTPPNPWGLVFTNKDRPISKRHDLQEWKQLQILAGVHKPDGTLYVTHEARHTTATLLLEAGAQPDTIQQIMGHSDVVAQQGYKHVSTDFAQKYIEILATKLQIGDSAPTR